MKIFFKTIAIMTVAGISILAVIGYTVIGESTELKKSADGFFHAVRANQTAQSHHYLSSDFKAITSASELDRLIQQMRLQRATSITWHGFSIHNQNGVLEGLMTLDDATQYTLTVSLSQHAQDWKISGFSVKPAQSVALNRQYSG